MSIIDCHLHLVETEGPMYEAAKLVPNLPTINGLKTQMKDNDIEKAVVITLNEDCDILAGLKLLKKIGDEHPDLIGISGIYPEMEDEEIMALRQSIEDGSVSGIKIYPSYYPYYPNDSTYAPVYDLALKYDLPVIIHTGAVMSGFSGKVYQKYALPIHVDDLAVDYPDLRILMAHAGYPWIIDAAQVAYKNENVSFDLSGLKEGNVNSTKLLDKHIMWALDYVDDDTKYMYGSDWPLVDMGKYIKWLSTIVPQDIHEKFFYENAKEFFRL